MEREVVQLMEGAQAWPLLHMMGTSTATATSSAACSFFDDYSSSSSSGSGSGDCFVLGWDWPEREHPAAPFGCFGLLAAADVHDLFPLFAGMESPLPVSSSSSALPAAPQPPAHDAVVPAGELDDLLLNFWDASCHDGDVGEPQQQPGAFINSSCVTHEQTCTDPFFQYDDGGDDPLSSIFCAGPAVAAEKDVLVHQAPPAEAEAEAEPLSSSSSNCRGGVDPHPPQGAAAAASATPSAARTPPLPRSSLKRATREAVGGGGRRVQPERRRRRQAQQGVDATTAPAVLCPFALLKPDGLDGGATLADINARILMRPARPVRHPVGEFACAPRVSADQPGISGKAVSSFTRLHTQGRGTITIIRTRG
ncbi:hypothetical protein U9M48_014555 [Paspalum notatum var. saurae]|uniref:Uncharacterized protein n=1 Tax=Paspalum notatum var. saurae TaxID=547442 RepID=A0AAQ3WKN3_PASNO